MRNLFLFFFVTLLTGSPLVAILVIAAVYLALDYQFVGVSRRLFDGFRRASEIRRLKRDLSVNPHDAAARAGLGRLLVSARRHAEAAPHLEQAIARMPDSDDAACDLGLAYLWTGKIPEGERLLRTALARNPKFRYGEPYLRWGEFLLSAGRVRDAAESLETFLSIHSSSVEGHYLLAEAYRREGNASNAAKIYRDALFMFKKSPGYKRRAERLWAWKARFRLMAG